MALTKSEFDRWKAQADAADTALLERPSCPGVGSFDRAGHLHLAISPKGPDQTRALYEMLRAWYGESLMTEKARAVIEALSAYMDVPSGQVCTGTWERLQKSFDAYRAEQKQ